MIIDSHPGNSLYFNPERNVVSRENRLPEYRAQRITNGGEYFLFDHHYEGFLADGRHFVDVTTTILVVDYLLHLLEQNRTDEIKKISKAVIFLDHKDVDIVLSGFAVRLLSDYKKKISGDSFIALACLLKDASFFNDHGVLPDDSSRSQWAKNLAYLILFSSLYIKKDE